MHLINQVLLIDDDHISNFITTSTLKRTGLVKNIAVCQNGKEAIDLLKHQSATAESLPDLILLDINMPTMNGFEFLEAFRVQGDLATRPIITILTTSQNQQDIEKLKNFPEVEVFLNKPLNEEDLQFLVEEYFSK